MGCEQSKSDVQEGCHKENAFRDEIIEMEDLEENRIQGMKWVPSDQKKNGEQSQYKFSRGHKIKQRTLRRNSKELSKVTEKPELFTESAFAKENSKKNFGTKNFSVEANVVDLERERNDYNKENDAIHYYSRIKPFHPSTLPSLKKD